jgi:hypothetical protein
VEVEGLQGECRRVQEQTLELCREDAVFLLGEQKTVLVTYLQHGADAAIQRVRDHTELWRVPELHTCLDGGEESGERKQAVDEFEQ